MDGVAPEALKLYHTKNYQGTTTLKADIQKLNVLYHTKNYQGTTTKEVTSAEAYGLYHTKNYQGTTTPWLRFP